MQIACDNFVFTTLAVFCFQKSYLKLKCVLSYTYNYCVSSNKRSPPRHLSNFETLRCGGHWITTFKRGWRLFESKKSGSYEMSKFCGAGLLEARA